MKPELEFDEPTHTYWLNDQKVPSVTQILKRVIPEVWPAGDYYMQRGRAVHHGCRLLDEGRLDWSTVGAEIEPRIRAWEKFRRDWPAEMVACEKPLAHAKLMYAGTLDRLLLGAENLLTICDLKNTVTGTVLLQMAAYSLLWTANGGGVVRMAVAVELLESGEYRTHWLGKSELRRAEQQWLAVLTVFGFVETHGLLKEKTS